MRDELESHILLRRDTLVQQGMDPESAMAEARRRFGDFGATQEQLMLAYRLMQRAAIFRRSRGVSGKPKRAFSIPTVS
jgi:hypothetical protein